MKRAQLVLILTSFLFVSQTLLAATVFLEGHELNAESLSQNNTTLKKMLPHVSDSNRQRIASYLTSIGLKPSQPYFKNEVNRLLEGSTQFILCPDIEDWSCLESTPAIRPHNKSRIDTNVNLATPIAAGEQLDIEYYFTQGWFNNLANYKTSRLTGEKFEYIIPEKTVAQILAEKMQQYGEKNIWMALYGIDDIAGTMASVYNTIKQKFESGVGVFAVIDVLDDQRPDSFIRDYDITRLENGQYSLDIQDKTLDYSYVPSENNPYGAFESPFWMKEYITDIVKLQQTLKPMQLKDYVQEKMFAPPSPDVQNDKTLLNKYKLRLADLAWITMNTSLNSYKEDIARTTFQYSDNLQLIKFLNSKATQNSESHAHLEFPFSGIMHNKYMVFEDSKGRKSVWSGTANVAQTCMGNEENANMSILIKNDQIAEAFLTEFNEMFNPVPAESLRPKTLMTGAFHDRKKPNTHRYFKFDDGTEVRVHFSPTDDGEHRALLPLIYSARAGDILRISMFGGSGFELVRAMQAAAARGADIRILFDALTGSGVNSWFRDVEANVLQPNNFTTTPSGKIEVRLNDWKGLNHHKSATLTRKQADGQYFPEVLVVGSQNWSQSGNDLNDENMVIIRNRTKALDITAAFNKEFDEKMWPSSSPPDSIKTLHESRSLLSRSTD